MTVLTLLLAIPASQVQVSTVFSDMLPQSHPWIKTNEEFKEGFGGSNLVSIMLRNEQGTVFEREFLERIRSITRDLRMVKGVNQFQIISLASKKLRTVTATGTEIDNSPLMWPSVPETQEEIEALREKVLETPLVYGRYVSPDLKSALVTVDFIDRLVDPPAIYKQINKIVAAASGPGIETSIVGEPVLYGWVQKYLPQTLMISLITILVLGLTLFLWARSWRGTLLPMVAGFMSATWALGIGALLGLNFDPLVVVVAFLITARSISHSVQLVTRFDDIIAEREGVDAREAARLSLAELFRPGTLGVVADAGAILVVLLTPIPLLQKVSIIGAIWVGTIFLSAVVMTPVLLSWIKHPGKRAHPINLDPFMHRVLDASVWVATTRARFFALGLAAFVFVLAGVLALQLQVGDARPGSPILWSDSDYNLGAARINDNFAGSDRMFVVFHGEELDAVKQPEVLRTMRRFQRYMEAQPEVGGSSSVVDVIASINRSLHEGNPRYLDLGADKIQNGQYLYLYVAGSDPGDLARFSDNTFRNGAVTLFFRDHTGKTIRSAFARIQEFIADNPMQHASYQLAGGLIGVLGAVNDVLLRGQIEAIALGLLVVVLCSLVAYRASSAGMFFMVPVLLSNTVTFAYMAMVDIGLNINTLPVVALGIGLGVDYSFYIVDGIKEDLAKHGDVQHAMVASLHSAGRGVFVTAATLIVSVCLWIFSSLRFQAEMGLLIALWLTVSATSALFVMPALAYVTRPDFIFGQADNDADKDTVAADASAPVRG